MFPRKSFSTDSLFVLLLYTAFTIILAIPREDVNDPFGSEWKKFEYTEQDTWGVNSSDTRLKLCQNGKAQSPVNIGTDEVSDGTALIVFVNYTYRTQAKIAYIGDKLIISDISDPRPSIRYEKDGEQEEEMVYKLHAIMIHFTFANESDGSEHHIDGEHADMEIQFMHKRVVDRKQRGRSAAEGWLGVAVRYKKERSQDKAEHIPDFSNCLRKFASETKKGFIGASTRCQLAPWQFFKRGASYYGYTGSLTVPPCTEKVTWFVAEEDRILDAEYLELLQGLVPAPRNTKGIQTKRKTKRVLTQYDVTKLRSILEVGIGEQRTRVLQLGRTLVFGAKYYLIIVILVLLSIYVMNA